MSPRPRDLRTDTLYSRSVLLEEGMHRRDLASDAMLRVLPGWWARADADIPLTRLAPFFLERVRPGAVLSHESAAELLGIPLPAGLTHAGGAPIHCRGPEGSSRTSGALVVAHRSTSDPVISHRGMRISHPLIALRDIASRLSPTDLVVGLDALAADRLGAERRMRLAEIEEFVADLRGLGVPALRRALPHVRERSWSPMETKLRLRLLEHGFPEPALNAEVTEPATGRTFYLDLAYPQERIAIEYDSEHHRKDRQVWSKDLNKTDVLHDLGWKVLRATIFDYQRPQELFARLADALQRRRPTP